MISRWNRRNRYVHSYSFGFDFATTDCFLFTDWDGFAFLVSIVSVVIDLLKKKIIENFFLN